MPSHSTLQEIKIELEKSYPKLKHYPVMLAVNREYAEPNAVLQDGDEIAFLPPVSGG